MKNREVKFIDNPENGVTVAMLGSKKYPASEDAIVIIRNLLNENSRYLRLNEYDQKKFEELLIQNTFKGVSKCCADYDTYNQDYGRELAEERCREKYDNAVAKRLIKFLNDIYTLEFAVEQYLLEEGILEYCEDCKCKECRSCESYNH